MLLDVGRGKRELDTAYEDYVQYCTHGDRMTSITEYSILLSFEVEYWCMGKQRNVALNQFLEKAGLHLRQSEQYDSATVLVDRRKNGCIAPVSATTDSLSIISYESKAIKAKILRNDKCVCPTTDSLSISVRN